MVHGLEAAFVKEDKMVVKDLYKDVFSTHIMEASKITGMTYYTPCNDRYEIWSAVYNKEMFVKSLKDDNSDENVKRACFVFYYSWNKCYRDVFSMCLSTSITNLKLWRR